MTVLPVEPGVDKRFLAEFIRRAGLLGIDVATVCRNHGLDHPLELPGERAPLAVVSRLYEAVERELQTPEFIYFIVSSWSVNSHDLTQLAQCCRTVGEAMRLICRYSAVASDVCTARLLESGAGYRLRVEPNRQVYVSPIQIEAVLFATVRQIQLRTPAASGLTVHFTHAPRFEEDRYARYFGCRVLFNQVADEMAFGPAVHDLPLEGADAARADYYAGILKRYESLLLAQGELPQRVQQLFIQRMAFGEPDQAEIAACLNLSTRSLHRQLQQQGTGFRELAEAARLAVAQRELLADNRPMQEVALMLGYSDRRAFYRAFRRWTGMTPSDWRAARPTVAS